MPAKVATKGGKPKVTTFNIDTSKLVAEQVLDPADLAKYLTENIKVNNKKKNLGSTIAITREKPNVITIKAKESNNFSKRYAKYLTKKYLKKQQLRDFVKVVASNKSTYELRFLRLDTGEEEAEEADE